MLVVKKTICHIHGYRNISQLESVLESAVNGQLQSDNIIANLNNYFIFCADLFKGKMNQNLDSSCFSFEFNLFNKYK